jgi:SAM-dependent methyltransferase
MERSQHSTRGPGDARADQGFLLGRCPACGSRNWRTHPSPRELPRGRCATCDLVFLNPQPRDRVREKYVLDYDLAAHFDRHRHRKRALFEERLRRIGGPRGAPTLCDVACGDGLFLEQARAHGWRGTGVELNPAAARRARERGFDVHEGQFETLEDLDFGGFAAVTSWDTLEHSARPREFMTRLGRLLKVGGRLYLTTLNNDSAVSRVFRSHWSMLVEDHFTYWNRSSLTRLAEASGIRVTAVWYFGVGRDFLEVGRRGGGVRTTPRPSTDLRRQPRHLSWPERTVNSFLNATALGVGIGIEGERRI